MTRPYLWDPWRTARAAPDRLAVVAGTERYTFGEIVARVDRLGAAIRASVPDGGVVSTDLPCGPRFFALGIAALRYGFVLFPVPPQVAAELPSPGGVDLHVTASPDGGAGIVSDQELVDRAAERPPAGQSESLAFVTSGTTGQPAVVRRARPWYQYRGVAVEERYAAGLTFGPHIMANPSHHLGTVGPALYALQAGSAVIVQRDWSPVGFAELVDQHGADSAFLSPDRLLDLVTHRNRPARALRVVLHGGAACPPAVKRAAIEQFGLVLHEFYGTSECVISEIAAAQWLARPGSVGRPLPGVRVEIVAEGVRQPAGMVGEVCVWPRAVDRHDLQVGGPTPTGDLGYVDQDGYLFLLGRAAEVSQVPLARLEHAVRCLPGVAAVAVATGGHLTCLVEGLPGWPDELAAQVRRAAQQAGTGSIGVDIRPVGSFPRTRSGKLWRTSG